MAAVPRPLSPRQRAMRAFVVHSSLTLLSVLGFVAAIFWADIREGFWVSFGLGASLTYILPWLGAYTLSRLWGVERPWMWVYLTLVAVTTLAHAAATWIFAFPDQTPPEPLGVLFRITWRGGNWAWLWPLGAILVGSLRAIWVGRSSTTDAPDETSDRRTHGHG